MFVMALTLMAVQPPPQPMTVEIVRDPITDAVSAVAELREGGNRLVVACNPARYSGVRISVHSRRWLARGNMFSGERPVTYRFDSREPRRTMWDIDDRQATLGGERVSSFLDHLVTADRLVVRAEDIEDHRFDMIFRLTGVRPAVEWALAVCTDAARRQA